MKEMFIIFFFNGRMKNNPYLSVHHAVLSWHICFFISSVYPANQIENFLDNTEMESAVSDTILLTLSKPQFEFSLNKFVVSMNQLNYLIT